MSAEEKTDDVPTSMRVTLALATRRPPEADSGPGPAPAYAFERPTPGELFERHVTFVWRVVAAHGVREADVPDLTQDVFVAAFRRLSDWDPARASATSWLYAIAVRVAANHRRKAHVRREAPGEGPVTPLETDPGAAIDRQRLLAELDEALTAMDAPKRDVFVLFEIAELTMHEVALTLGCPLKTAYKRLYAARRELAEKIGDEGRAR
jgi:RNA polymerase sigma-70 factor (ECF subfamily)